MSPANGPVNRSLDQYTYSSIYLPSNKSLPSKPYLLERKKLSGLKNEQPVFNRNPNPMTCIPAYSIGLARQRLQVHNECHVSVRQK